MFDKERVKASKRMVVLLWLLLATCNLFGEAPAVASKADKQATARSNAVPVGTFYSYNNTLAIKHLKGDSYTIQVHATWGQGEATHEGEATATGTIRNGTGAFLPTNCSDCAFLLKIAGRRVMLIQHGSDADCGMGMNVNATGTYSRSRKQSEPAERARAPIGFLDVNGRYPFPGPFQSVKEFSNGLAAVEIKGRWGYVGHNGKAAFPSQYKSARSFSNGLAAVQETSKWGYIDRNGKMVIRPMFDEAWEFSKDGLAEVRQSEIHQFIDRTGTILKTKVAFDHCNWFNEGRAVVWKGWKGEQRGVISERGEEVVPLSKAFIGDFHDGLAPFADEDSYDAKRGYMNRNGKVVVEPKFDGAEEFSEGLARVKVNGKWGYIDTSGRLVIPPQFRKCSRFSDGVAFAMPVNCGSFILIDKSGKKIGHVPDECTEYGDFTEGNAVITLWTWDNDLIKVPISKDGHILPPFNSESAPGVEAYASKHEGLFLSSGFRHGPASSNRTAVRIRPK